MEFDYTFCPCKVCSEGQTDGPIQEQTSKRTPYAVKCEDHNLVYLSYHEYVSQILKPDNLWECPICRKIAKWSDDNYEEAMDNNPD